MRQSSGCLRSERSKSTPSHLHLPPSTFTFHYTPLASKVHKIVAGRSSTYVHQRRPRKCEEEQRRNQHALRAPCSIIRPCGWSRVEGDAQINSGLTRNFINLLWRRLPPRGPRGGRGSRDHRPDCAHFALRARFPLARASWFACVRLTVGAPKLAKESFFDSSVSLVVLRWQTPTTFRARFFGGCSRWTLRIPSRMCGATLAMAF